MLEIKEVLRRKKAGDSARKTAYDLIVDGESYRPRLKPQLEAAGPPPAAPVNKTQLRREVKRAQRGR